MLSAIRPALAVTVPLKLALPASDISSVNAVIPEPPSSPLKIISLSCTLDSITKSDDEFTKSPIAVPSSLNVTLPPFASKIISPSTSTVKSAPSEIVEPSIVMSSTVKVVKVPKLVILVCAASDTFKLAKASTIAPPAPAPSE